MLSLRKIIPRVDEEASSTVLPSNDATEDVGLFYGETGENMIPQIADGASSIASQTDRFPEIAAGNGKMGRGMACSMPYGVPATLDSRQEQDSNVSHPLQSWQRLGSIPNPPLDRNLIEAKDRKIGKSRSSNQIQSQRYQKKSISTNPPTFQPVRCVGKPFPMGTMILRCTPAMSLSPFRLGLHQNFPPYRRVRAKLTVAFV